MKNLFKNKRVIVISLIMLSLVTLMWKEFYFPAKNVENIQHLVIILGIAGIITIHWKGIVVFLKK